MQHMRPGQNKQRMRGGRPNNRFKGGHSGGGGGGGGGPNRSFDSTGPDVKLRGTASQLYDKYLALARDANAGGDRVAAENYLQHAEHYYRVMLANGFNPNRQQQPNGGSVPQGQGGQPQHGQHPQQMANPAMPGAPQPMVEAIAPVDQQAEQPDPMFADGDLDNRY
jgi:hypothetical protein